MNMSFKYNLTVTEILQKMGYTKTKDNILNEQQKGIVLPAVLNDFLSLAINTSLFSTSDVWVQTRRFICFLYDYIEENIEDEKEYWENDNSDADESEYYKFYKLPKEQWKDIVPNYLLIGSDFAAGIINFGICITDLDKSDPPVYMNHECDSICEWKLYTNSISEFLMLVFCDILSYEMYDTAMDTLEDEGWEADILSEYELNDYKIDFDAMVKYPSFYDRNALLGCAYDEDKHILLVVKFDENNEEILNCIAYCKECDEEN